MQVDLRHQLVTQASSEGGYESLRSGSATIVNASTVSHHRSRFDDLTPRATTFPPAGDTSHAGKTHGQRIASLRDIREVGSSNQANLMSIGRACERYASVRSGQ